MDQYVKHSDQVGNSVTVVIHPKQWVAMQELIDLRANEVDKEDGLVDEQVLMYEMQISKRRLANMISSGKISKDMYTVLPNGRKKFFYKKIMGLEK